MRLRLARILKSHSSIWRAMVYNKVFICLKLR